MFETLGSYLRQTIYMSTQNGSYLEISWKRNFDSHLRIKDTAPYFCIGKPYVCNVFRPRAT